jgi:hypothetical protein
MLIVLRVDDIGLRPDKTPDAGLDLGRRLHEAMGGRPYLAGIVPGMLDADAIAWLRSAPRGMTIAMHGWRHALSRKGLASEFNDWDRSQCGKILGDGRRILGGAVADFIPPWNHLPRQLAIACADQRMDRIWGDLANGPEPEPPRPMLSGWFIPSWRAAYGATGWPMGIGRPSLIDAMEPFAGSALAAVATLHITWEASFSSTFDGVRRFADRFGPDLIEPGDYVRHFETEAVS